MHFIARQGGERIAQLWQRVQSFSLPLALRRGSLRLEEVLTTTGPETLLTRRKAIDVAYGRDIGGNTFLTAKDGRIYTGVSHPKTLRRTPSIVAEDIIDSGRLWPDSSGLGIVVNSKSFELNVPHGGQGREVTVKLIKDLVAGQRRPLKVTSS